MKKRPSILAIETSTEACSVALSMGSDLQERFQLASRQHADLILSFVDELLSTAQTTLTSLDAIAFGAGPGSFTGIRIAVSVAQGLAYAADLPVIPVSTLSALAQGVIRENGVSRVAACLDARMGQIYWNLFEVNADGLVMPLQKDQLSDPEQFALPNGNPADLWTIAGSGCREYPSIIIENNLKRIDQYFPNYYPHAQDVNVLAQADFLTENWVSADQALPVYLRHKVVG